MVDYNISAEFVKARRRNYLGQVTRLCAGCHKTFQINQSRINAGEGTFCGKSCFYSWIKTTTEQRFWSHVNKTETCWIWTLSKDSDGYGHVGVNGKLRGAHKVSWEFAFGPIPDGLDVLHKCNNRPCVRPDHLFLGTHQDNMEDMIRKGRQIILRGEDNGHSKLREYQVTEIRSSLAKGTSCHELAALYGVNRRTISAINCGHIWRHVQ